jgi:hypothetical protein
MPTFEDLFLNMNEQKQLLERLAVLGSDARTIAAALHAVPEPTPTPDPTPDPEPHPDTGDLVPDLSLGTFTRYNRGEGRDSFIDWFRWDPSGPENVLRVTLPDAFRVGAPTVFVADLSGSVIHVLTRVAFDSGARPQYDGDVVGGVLPSGCVLVAKTDEGVLYIWQLGRSDSLHVGPGWGTEGVLVSSVLCWQATATEPAPPPGPAPAPGAARLLVWREGSAASNLGCRNALCVARTGKTDGDDIRLVYMNGELATSVQEMVRRTQQAKAEGCVGVCIDLESHMILTGRVHCERVAAAVRSVLPLWWAPKVYLDHMIKHWGGDFAYHARWLQAHGDGLIPWIYSKADAKPWLDLRKAFARAGYTKPFVCLGDFRSRTSAGARTAAFTPQAIREFRAAGASVGVFAPDTNHFDQLVLATPAWKEACRAYG